MKKRMLLILAVLLALACLYSAGAERSPRPELKIRMAFSASGPQAGDTIQVTISLTNTSGKDFTGAMWLYDPDGKQIDAFGEPVLKDWESAGWTGDWTVTEQQIKEKRITFTVRYSFEDENGNSVNKTKHFSKKIVGTEAAPEHTPVPEAENPADILLYGVYRPNPSTGWVAVGCIDTAGDVWLAERADVPWPALDEDVRKMLKTCRGMRKYESLIGQDMDGTLMNDAWFFTDVPAMIDSIPLPKEKPRKTGFDIGQEAVWALRKNETGEEESVMLGMAGSYLYENPSPDAQRLYLFMWRLMQLDEIFNTHGIGLATEGAAPQGFRGVTIRDFYGLAEADYSKASVTAVWLDAEGGPAEAELAPEKAEELRALAERGMVIRKENRWTMPEDVLTCVYTDEQGKELGRIRLFSYTAGTDEDGGNIIKTLAAAEDGMYQTVLAPRPVDSLPEEELRMLTVSIEGVDYLVGKSTPRDLIRNGWTCFPELDGTFTFQDPEMNNTIGVRTAGCSLDEPITHISCQFAYNIDISYCGYDGILDPDDPKDPDYGYFRGDPGAEKADNKDTDPGDEDEPGRKYWAALTGWIHGVLGADQDTSEPGTSVCVSLSDGRFLYLYSASSPVSITLSEHGPKDETW